MNDIGEACRMLKGRLGYPSYDARIVALDNILGMTQSAQMVLNLLDSWTIGDELIRQVIPQLVGVTPVTPESVRIAGDTLNKTSKLAFAILPQFQIENVLRNIAVELRLPPGGTGFYRLAWTVLTHLNLPAHDFEILNTPARIRNSLHANGIHHQQHPSEQAVVVINGVTYEFHDRQPVRCATWEHIAHAFESSVGVLDRVFQAGPVRALNVPLFDHYAWEEETTPFA